MKRLLAVLLALCSLFIPLTGCVNREEENASSSSSSSPSSAPSSSSSVSEPEQSTSSEPEEPSAPDAPPVFSPTMEADLTELKKLPSEAVTWGPTNYIADDDNRPVACVGLQKEYGQYDSHFIAPNTNQIYLTFDEGYELGYTGSILDTLKEKKVSAVFFITMDYAKRNPDLVRRMIDEGHAVGNHSCTHPDFSTITLEQAYEEVKGLHDYVQENFDYSMGLFRFPEGIFTEQSIALLQEMGYKGVFWSFAYADWDPKQQMAPAAALEKIKGWSHPGAIYLLHAVSATNDEILPELIDWLRSEGYEFRPFDLTLEDALAEKNGNSSSLDASSASPSGDTAAPNNDD